VKKRLTIGIVGAALAATLTFVAAGSSNRGAGTDRDAATVPDAQPAYETPEQATIVYAPAYTRGPRIIHVPQADDRDDDRSSANYRDEPAASNDDDDDVQSSPPPRTRVMPPARTSPRWTPRSETPKPQPRSDAPPSGARRAILSVPPPPPEGPSPIRPIPRFGQKADSGEKFAAPRGRTLSESSPPPGYTPPAALPNSGK
jgi:hypothetical protein